MITWRRKAASILFGFFYAGALLNGIERGLRFALHEENDVLSQWPLAEATVLILIGILSAFLAAYAGRSMTLGILTDLIVLSVILALNPWIVFAPSERKGLSWLTAVLMITLGLPAARFGYGVPLDARDVSGGRLIGVAWWHWLWLWIPWQFIMIPNAVWFSLSPFATIGDGAWCHPGSD